MDSVICTSASNNNNNNNRSGNSLNGKTRGKSSTSLLSSRSTKTKHNLIRNHSLNHKNNHRSTSNAGSTRNQNKLIVNNINNTTTNSVFNNNNINNAQSNIIAIGAFTQEVHNTIALRLGNTVHIPADSLQCLFNDMHLYPSKTQVSRMLQIARQCSRPNAATDYLTFGEFCVYAKVMQQPERPKNNKCEVFLGGSCNPTTWRADTAIPELKKYGISFYNPQVSMWAPELVAQEHDAKQAASVLLFVIDSQTRSTVGMIEVAYLVASGRCVVVVAQPYNQGQSIMGEVITNTEFLDLFMVQNTLISLVKSKGVKIHSNLTSALECTAKILRNNSNTNTTTDEEFMETLKKYRDAYDSYGGDLSKLLDAYKKLTNQTLESNKILNSLRSSSNGNNINATMSFDKFCVLMAELSTDGCDMYTRDAWARESLQRQCSTNNNSCNLNNSLIESSSPAESTLNNHNCTFYDIFLGGSLNSSIAWRDRAIPLVKQFGLSYYNPTIRERLDNVNEADLDVLDHKTIMDRSNVLLFVITNDTRSMTSMVMAAHFIGLNRKVVLAVQHLDAENCVIQSETLTKNAIKDYNRARVYLTDLAKRKNYPVFENITHAIQCAIELCKDL